MLRTSLAKAPLSPAIVAGIGVFMTIQPLRAAELRPAATPQAPQNINIGPAELLRTDAQIPFTFDGSCPTLKKDGSSLYFFQTSDSGNTHLRFSGTVDDPFKTRERAYTMNDNGYVGGKWIMNVYKIDSTNILGFIHRETRTNDPKCEYYIGLAKSKDGGATWTYLGDVCAPEDRFGNIGGVPYLVVGDYFYVYFNEHPKSGRKRLSVARAKISDTLVAFNANTVPVFTKYSDGSWDQNGMTGLASHIMPISMDTEDSKQPDLHSDAAYCRPLGKYLITVQTHAAGQLLMFTSTNGIDWGEQTVVDENPKSHYIQAYSFFAGLDNATDDCREVGSDFYIFFPRKDWPAHYGYDEFYRCHVTITGGSSQPPVKGEVQP